MSNNFSIREATRADLDTHRTIFRKVWGFSRPQTYDEWRLFDNPFGQTTTVLACMGDCPIGFYTLWPMAFRLGSEQVIGAASIDLGRDPDISGKGVFVRMAEAAYDLARERGIEILYAFPNQFTLPGKLGRLNWDHAGSVSNWKRILHPSGHPRIPRAVGIPAELIAALLPKGSTHGLRVVPERPPENLLTVLAEKWNNGARLCRIERSKKWFDWRYDARAGMNYEWLSAYDGEELLAVAVWGMQTEAWVNPDRRAHLMELLGDDRRGLAACVATVVARARARSAILLETLTDDAPISSILKRAGFFRHGGDAFVVRGLTNRTLGGNIHNFPVWRIMGGDMDPF